MGSSSTNRAEGLLMRSRTGAAYRFDPGALCLELLITGGPGEFRGHEVLHTPDDLAAWADRSRLTPTPALELDTADVTDARRLRDALWRIALARTGGEQAAAPHLAVVNRAASRMPLTPAVGPDGTRAWAGTGTGAQLLSTVARDAVELLTGPYAHRVRMCAADDCSLVYFDTSRPGRRRWCSMEHCGNRHKVRTLRARRSEEG